MRYRRRRPKDGKPDGEKAKTEGKKPKADSAVGKLADQLLKAIGCRRDAVAERDQLQSPLLRFQSQRRSDRRQGRRSGAAASGPHVVGGAIVFQFQFPRIDVTIDDEGTKLDYSFFLEGYVMASPDFSYVSISLNAAAYREGDITLDGKKRHVVLIDFNSNGRFDDEIKIPKDVHAPDGQLYPEQGDMLLVDPEAEQPGSIRPTTSRPAAISALRVEAGQHRRPLLRHEDFARRRQAHADAFLRAAGQRDEPERRLPRGDLRRPGFPQDSAATRARRSPCPRASGSCCPTPSTATERQGAEQAAEKKPAEKKEEGREELAAAGRWRRSWKRCWAARARPGSVSVYDRHGPGDRRVQGGQGRQGRDGRAALRPAVQARGDGLLLRWTGNEARSSCRLDMSLVGSAGEVCTNMMVDGGRPSKPEFTITDPKGKVVQQGNFEYG